MSTRTRFEREAKGNSEMAYWPIGLGEIVKNNYAKQLSDESWRPVSNA